MRKISVFNFLILFIGYSSLESCDFVGGVGFIKGYKYGTTKYELERAFIKVMKNNPNIKRDTIRDYVIDVTNGKDDTIEDNYWNDGIRTFTIKIKTQDIEDEYTLSFYGDEKYWKTSQSSEIAIRYAYNKDGKGGAEGKGTLDNKLKKELTDVFEAELISKIDKELSLKHTEEE